MKIENSVKSQTMPWFMDASKIDAKVASLDADIKPHVLSIIENGFAIIKGSVPKSHCIETIARFKAIADANPDKFQGWLDADGHYPRIINLHALMPELFELFWKNRMSYRVQQALFGATPALYTSLFYERGSAQTIHRDTPVFSTNPEYFYFGVWVALEDSNVDNGALQVYRGGHKMPELNREEIAIARFGSLDKVPAMSNDLWVDYQTAVDKQCAAAGLKVESLCVEAGDTVIWHPQLPHGGGPIGDLTKSRFSFVMHTTPVGTPVYHQDKFFNPNQPVEIDAQWWYEKVEDGYRVIQPEINFAHKESFAVSAFTMPQTAKEGKAPEQSKGFFNRLLRT